MASSSKVKQAQARSQSKSESQAGRLGVTRIRPGLLSCAMKKFGALGYRAVARDLAPSIVISKYW